MTRWPVTVVAAAGCAAATLAHAAADADRRQTPRMEFVAPQAGTYELQRIQPATDAMLLESTGELRRLASYTRDKITLLTFFYTYCVDPWGCPFAYQTLTGLRARVVAEPDLVENVRFVNVSFDPTNDTPAALARYAALLQGDPRFEWRFLTARSVGELLPLLDGFGQDVAIVYGDQGRPTRTINHMLKLFLIDADGNVREIYTLAYVQPQVMFNDIWTLLLEQRPGSGPAPSAGAP